MKTQKEVTSGTLQRRIEKLDIDFRQLKSVVGRHAVTIARLQRLTDELEYALNKIRDTTKKI
jgi:hypothetical protein